MQQPLADAIAYQKDAIVSRILLKKKSGSVTLFAFDRGQELSEHTTAFDALLYVFDGTAEVTIAGEAHVVQSGAIIHLPANRPHAVKALGPFKMMLVMLKE